MTKEQKSVENRERRERLKSLGMCVHCGKAKNDVKYLQPLLNKSESEE